MSVEEYDEIKDKMSKITFMDGIKWLEALCKRLIPITLFAILGMVCFDLGKKLIDDENLLSVKIKTDKIHLRTQQDVYNLEKKLRF